MEGRICGSMEERKRYFESALSDFVYDVASGAEIRHLVDSGYSVEQIREKLDYSVSGKRLEQTVYNYMTESGILLTSLPVKEEEMKKVYLENIVRRGFYETIREYLLRNGEHDSYIQCPFCDWVSNGKTGLLSCLTRREQQYILGITWTSEVMYHRLNERMFEIAAELSLNCSCVMKYYFLKEKTEVIVIP